MQWLGKTPDDRKTRKIDHFWSQADEEKSKGGTKRWSFVNINSIILQYIACSFDIA